MQPHYPSLGLMRSAPDWPLPSVFFVAREWEVPLCSLWDVSFPTRDWTQGHSRESWSPNLWTSRESPLQSFYSWSSHERDTLKKTLKKNCFSTPRDMQDLSSPTRDQSRPHCSESTSGLPGIKSGSVVINKSRHVPCLWKLPVAQTASCKELLHFP